MKERIREFYEDHKTAIVLGSASLAVAALVTYRKMREPEVADATLWQGTNGDFLIKVSTSNGKNAFFDITPKVA